MKYDNLYTTYTDKMFNVFIEIDRTHDIMRMTNEKQYVRVMELPKYRMYNDFLVDWRQYENEVHNWSKQAFNDNEGQIIKKDFNGKMLEGTIECETSREYNVRWSGGRAFGILQKKDAGEWYSVE